MIGPSLKKMPDKEVCIDCELILTTEAGGTKRFPKKRIIKYCSHRDLNREIAHPVQYIKQFPYTPKWCPGRKNNDVSDETTP